MRLRLSTFFILLLGVFSTSCVEQQLQQQQYIRNGISYGTVEGSFRGRWWNYYERGRSFGDGRFYSEAAEDFQKAVNGRKQDKWRARTYGMHFVDYFPHRELGIIHYQQNNYDQAIAELLSSLKSAPSAKASFFLNRAREAQLKENQQDQQSPKVVANFINVSEVTNKFTARISGIASDDSYVAAIQIGANKLPIELAEPEISFSSDIPLREGDNHITIQVTDLVGQTTEQSLHIYADHHGPLIQLQQIRRSGPGVHLSGQLMDTGGLSSLLVNAKKQHIPAGSRNFSFSLDLATDDIILQATDTAGNTTTARIGPNSFAAVTPVRFFAALQQAAAVHQVSSDAGSGIYAASSDVTVDRRPPKINFQNLTTDESSYDELFLLEGEASDISGIESLVLDQQTIQEKGGQKIFFSILKQLQPGTNSFRFKAVDTEGNQGKKTITVTRKVQKIRQIGSRMSIAILPFEKKGAPSLLGDILYDKLIDSFIEQKRFRLVERKELDNVLQELQLSASELTDPDHALQVGKLLSAHTLLSGTVIETGDSVEVVARLVDTESTAVMTSNDVFDQDKSLRAIDHLLDRLAFKFKQDFPLHEGIILEVHGNSALVDIGSSKNLLPYSRLICFKEGKGIKHPVTGKILGAKAEILGDLKVVQVDEEFSQADIIHQNGEMKQLDKIILR